MIHDTILHSQIMIQWPNDTFMIYDTMIALSDFLQVDLAFNRNYLEIRKIFILMFWFFAQFCWYSV